MVQKFYKQQDLKLALFFNSRRGLKALKSLRGKLDIKYVFLAKKNLDKKIIKEITEDYIIINSLKNPVILKKIKQKKINLIISAGFPYIFGEKFFSKKNKIDILNLHGGPTPRYRGGSPLIWQKIEGRRRIGISVLKINKYIDAGKIMGVKFFLIKDKENIKDIYNKSEKLFCNLLWNVIKKYYLRERIKVDNKKTFPSKYYFQRQAKNSLITPDFMESNKINNFHKALVPLYEEPFLYYGEKKISLKTIKTTNRKTNNKIGFVEKIDNDFFLNLKDKKLKLVKTSFDIKKIKNKFLSSEILHKDIWLEKTFNRNCYNSYNEKYIQLFKNYKKSFIFLKTTKPISKNNFSDINLRYLGRNITYQKKNMSNDKYFKLKNISYKTSLNDFEKKKVIDIAFRNFKTSRFHLDNRLSQNKSDLIRKQWMIDHFKGLRGEKIFVQFYKKKLSGFCLIKFETDDIARIDLICIDKEFTNKGLAKDLAKYSLYNLKKIKKKTILVSTQEKNLPAIKLYDSLKFSLKGIVYLYHYIS